MFAARPGPPPPGTGPRLIRARRRAFPGPAAFLSDDTNRARVESYFTDMTGTSRVSSELGHSYGEMAKALIDDVVSPQEPVELLILAFSIHDMWPGRATATYLSHLCPGTPLSFAICDQGSAAPFTALRLIRDYNCPRALLIAVEQSTLPYDSPAIPPEEHRGVAMLFGDGNGPRLANLRQRCGVAPDAVADLVTADIADLTTGRSGARVVLSDALATAWPNHPDHTAAPARQPTTGPWWHLPDTLTSNADPVVVADYDLHLRYLCLAGFAPAS